jgi:hypothetical protein
VWGVVRQGRAGQRRGTGTATCCFTHCWELFGVRVGKYSMDAGTGSDRRHMCAYVQVTCRRALGGTWNLAVSEVRSLICTAQLRKGRNPAALLCISPDMQIHISRADTASTCRTSSGRITQCSEHRTLVKHGGNHTLVSLIPTRSSHLHATTLPHQAWAGSSRPLT